MSWQIAKGASFAFFVAAFLAASQNASGQSPRPQLIEFKSGHLDLKGFIWNPSGESPFPALLWNHGSEKLPGSADSVAPYFVSKGYVFFVPHRSPGPYIMDELNQAGSRVARGRLLVKLHEMHLEDQLAALQYLEALPYVDKSRIAVMGFPLAGSKPCWPLSVDRAIASL